MRQERHHHLIFLINREWNCCDRYPSSCCASNSHWGCRTYRNAALDHRGTITLDSVRVLMMHFLNICLISGSQRLSTARLLNCVRASPLNVKNVEVTL